MGRRHGGFCGTLAPKGLIMATRLETLLALLQQHPEDPFVRYGVAMEYKNQNQWEASHRIFEELAIRHPAYVPQYLMHGHVLEQLQRLPEAQAVYQKGLQEAQRAGQTHAAHELQAAKEALVVRLHQLG